MAASATFALKAGVWFRRGRLIMVSPDSQATACPPSGRNSTYRPVQISGASSMYEDRCQFYALSKRGASQESIAEVLGVSQSAVSREMYRNQGQRGYRFI